MIKQCALAALAAFAFGGCATMGGKAPKAAQATGPVDFANADEKYVRLGAISDASIPEKQCGMVLWTLEGSRPAAVFRFISGDKAEIQVAGRLVSLTRYDFSGASSYGVFEEQHFRSDDGLEVDVNARFGLGFSGGAYLEQGIVKVRDNAGWSLVSPTAGIAGCRN